MPGQYHCEQDRNRVSTPWNSLSSWQIEILARTLLPRQAETVEEPDLGPGLRCLDSHRTCTILLASRSWPACFIFLSRHFIIHKNRKINGSHTIGLWALNKIIYVKCLQQCVLHWKSSLLWVSTDCSAKATPQQASDVKMGSVYSRLENISLFGKDASYLSWANNLTHFAYSLHLCTQSN